MMLLLRMVLLAAVSFLIRPAGSPNYETDTDIVSDLVLTPQVGMISVGWSLQKPSGEVQWYDVRWRDDTGDSRSCIVHPHGYPSTLISTEECTLKPPLRPCTRYRVLVLPKRNDDELIGLFDSKSANTLPEAPSMPEQVDCSLQPGSNFLTLSWRAPQTPCNITGYNISWSSTCLWSHNTSHGSVTHTSPALSYTLTGITPYTEYGVCVAGVVREKFVGSGNCCKDTSPETTPSAPQKLVVLQATSSSLSLQWQQPEQHNGILTGYSVQWNINGDESLPINNVKLSGRESTYMISGLSEDEYYYISVQACTSAGAGEAAVGVFHTEAAEKSSTIYIAGISVAIGLFVLVIVLLGVILYKKEKGSGRKSTKQNDNELDLMT